MAFLCNDGATHESLSLSVHPPNETSNCVTHCSYLCRHPALNLLREECANVHCCLVEEAGQSVIAALTVAFVVVDGILDAKLQGKYSASRYRPACCARCCTLCT